MQLNFFLKKVADPCPKASNSKKNFSLMIYHTYAGLGNIYYNTNTKKYAELPT